MNTRTPLSFSFINITSLESERWPCFRIEIRQWPLLDGSRAKSRRSTALIEAACTTQKRPHGASFPMARDVAPSSQIAPVDSATPANGIALLSVPATKPDSPAMDDSDGEKNCPSNQEAPEFFIEASVEVLAPARQAQQSSKKSR